MYNNNNSNNFSVKSNVTEIPLLTVGNYPQWQRLMSLALKSKGLMYTLSIENELKDFAPRSGNYVYCRGRQAERDHNARITCDMETAVSMILQNCSPEIAEKYEAYEEPKRLWDELKKVYGNKQNDILVLIEQFFTLQWTPGSTISKHLSTINDLAAQLVAAGQAISQEMKLYVLTRSLPPELEGFTVVKQTYDELSDNLLNCEVTEKKENIINQLREY